MGNFTLVNFIVSLVIVVVIVAAIVWWVRAMRKAKRVSAASKNAGVTRPTDEVPGNR